MKDSKTILLCLTFFFISAFSADELSFEQKQKNYERVKVAYSRMEETVLSKCRDMGISEKDFGNIFLRVFKKEEVLEIWIQKQNEEYVLFDTFTIYAQSGRLGPKRQQGDLQVPEGFYYINDFNPVSNYHLSLGINYPNESDRKLSQAKNRGGDIYIHGNEVSAGCLAMSDYYIEEIYICAVKARNRGQQKIPVHIFPFRMTNENLAYYSSLVNCVQFKPFWKNISEGYWFFEKKNAVPVVTVNRDGNYRFFGE